MASEEKEKLVMAVAEFRLGARMFETVLKSVLRFTDEATVTVTGRGLVMRMMEPSRCAMFDYFIPREKMDYYYCHTEGLWCFDVATVLKRGLTMLRKDTTLEVFVDGKDMKTTFTLIDTRERRRMFPQLENIPEPAPALKFPKPTCRIAVDARKLQRDIADLKNFCNQITLVGCWDGLVLRATGYDGEEYVNFYELGGGDVVLDASAEKKTTATYSSSHLVEWGIHPSLSDVAVLEWTDNHLLTVKHKDSPYGTFVHHIAPYLDV